MMTKSKSLRLYTLLSASLSDKAREIAGDVVDVDAPLPPRDPKHGNYASSAALALARVTKRNPRDVANELCKEIEADFPRMSAQVAGPGFVNVTFNPDLLLDIMQEAAEAGADYGSHDYGDDVILEYGSANPTGPLHIGHARGLIIGSAMTNLLRKAGHNVKTEYYVNDAGGQVAELARSVMFRVNELTGRPNAGNRPAYPGAYVAEIARLMIAERPELANAANPDVSPTGEVARFAVLASMKSIVSDLSTMGISFDSFVYESEITSEDIQDLFSELSESGLLYVGTLLALPGKPPSGPRQIFKSTAYGDDQDRALTRDDGSLTYFANDCVNHARKSREAQRLITVFGEDHAGYVARIKALVASLDTGAELTVPIVRTVHLMRDGKHLVMSKRAGTFETVRDLLDEVPQDVLRMSMLTRSPDGAVSFDLDVAVKDGATNPVWGVNYAHARLCSVIEKSEEYVLGAPGGEMSTEERLVADLVADWPRIVQASARALEPHRVAVFARSLADAVNAWWSAGNADPSQRVLSESDPAATARRVLVSKAAQATLASALGVIGVAPAMKMNRLDRTVSLE